MVGHDGAGLRRTCNITALLCLTSTMDHAAISTCGVVCVTCSAHASCTSSLRLFCASKLSD